MTQEANHGKRRSRETLPVPAKALRCLVVEHEELSAEAISDILVSMGHSVECAGSGQEAISRFSADRFDLVLIFHGPYIPGPSPTMPGMSGWAIARAVKRAAPATRVILATGASYPDMSPERLQANGIDVMLCKPFSVEDLVGILGTDPAITGS